MRLRAALAAAAVVVTTAVVGVSGDADAPTATSTPASPTFLTISYSPSDSAARARTSNADTAAVTLTAHDTAPVGPTVLDETHHTLYRFDRDTASPSTSSCVSTCAETWPPVLVTPGSSVQLTGIDPATVGTVVRPDRTLQLTLDGWPIYRYAADRGPADLAGHGVGGIWWAVTPTGGRVPIPEADRAAAATRPEQEAGTPSRGGDTGRGTGGTACLAIDPAGAAAELADTAAGTGADLMRALLGVGPADDRRAPGQPDGSSRQARLPSDVIDLTDWYLTLPTGQEGSPDTVEQPALRELTNEFFQVNPAGDGVVFTAPTGGVTTKNSNFPRSELREMNGTEKAAWSNTSGTHVLDVCEAITEVPTAKPEVVAAQIHDGNDDVMQIRLEDQTLMVQYNDGQSEVVIDPAYKRGTPYHVRIVAADSKVRVLYNGEEKAELPLAGSGWYWKVGAYTQSDESGERTAGEVTVYSLTVDHGNAAAAADASKDAGTGPRSDGDRRSGSGSSATDRETDRTEQDASTAANPGAKEADSSSLDRAGTGRAETDDAGGREAGGRDAAAESGDDY